MSDRAAVGTASVVVALVVDAVLVVGMLLRLATGQGTAVAFIVVAMLTLAVLLLGWRAIAWAAIRLRARGRVGAA